MQAAADFLRLCLGLTMVGMSLLGIFALRRRPLSWTAFTLWGLASVFLPLVGPFLAILWARPAERRRRGSR